MTDHNEYEYLSKTQCLMVNTPEISRNEQKPKLLPLHFSKDLIHYEKFNNLNNLLYFIIQF